MKMINKIAYPLLLGSLSAIISTYGVTTVGGINFADNAFADVLISSSDPGDFVTSGADLASVLTDNNPTTYAFSFGEAAYVELGFTDNTLINGPGADLALFELGVPDSFQVSLTIGGTTLTYGSVDTGEDVGGFDLNLSQVDLNDFGILPGTVLNSAVIGLSISGPSGTVPSLSLVAAINSGEVTQPVPDAGSTLALLALSIAGFLGLSRLSLRRNA